MPTRVTVWVIAAACLRASPSIAAPPAGTLAGRAIDESGAPLPGVTVEAESPALSAPRFGVTDGSGECRLEGLPTGRYRVSFKLLDFMGVVRRDLSVSDGQTARAEATMRLSVSADVLVTGKNTFRNLADV